MSDLDSLKNLSLSNVPGLRPYDVEFAAFADTNLGDAIPLSAQEQSVLRLHDRLKEIELERCLLETREELSPGQCYRIPLLIHYLRPAEATDEFVGDDLEEHLKIAEQELLESQAGYSLKNKIIEGVTVADPTLKAVHSGANALPAERELLPLIKRRDVLSMAHTNLSSSLSSSLAALTTAETENILASRTNRELAVTLLDLAGELKTQDAHVKDPIVRSKLETLEHENRIRKSRWRIMKSVLGATVVGSGVDWARDDVLRELVMDNEEGM